VQVVRVDGDACLRTGRQVEVFDILAVFVDDRNVAGGTTRCRRLRLPAVEELPFRDDRHHLADLRLEDSTGVCLERDLCLEARLDAGDGVLREGGDE